MLNAIHPDQVRDLNLARFLFSRFAASMNFGAQSLAAAGLLIELAVILFTITERSLINHTILWNDEVSRIALSTITFIGGATAYRSARHTSIRLITDRLSERARRFVAIIIEWLVLMITMAVAWQSIDLLMTSWSDLTPILQISVGWMHFP